MPRTNYAAAGICSRCKLPKDLRKSSPRWCVECYREYMHEYNKQYDNKEARQRSRAKYKQTEKYKETRRRYRKSKTKPRISLSKQGICSQCNEQKDLRTSSPKWCKECYTIYMRQYSKTYTNHAARLESRIRYKQSARYRITKANAKHKRRALLKDAGRFTLEEWNILIHAYNYKCLRCGEQKPLTVDHVIPLSKGGSNTIDNIQPLCHSCNSAKGTLVIDYRYAGLEK